MQDERNERISDATHEADRRDADAKAGAGRGPTPEEEAAADKVELDPSVAEANKEAVERGANAKGEGRID